MWDGIWTANFTIFILTKRHHVDGRHQTLVHWANADSQEKQVHNCFNPNLNHGWIPLLFLPVQKPPRKGWLLTDEIAMEGCKNWCGFILETNCRGQRKTSNRQGLLWAHQECIMNFGHFSPFQTPVKKFLSCLYLRVQPLWEVLWNGISILPLGTQIWLDNPDCSSPQSHNGSVGYLFRGRWDKN